LSIPNAKAHSKAEPTKKAASGLWAERAAMKVPIGDPVLDSALGGGLPNNGVILVGGEPGTGKTTLAATFIYNGAVRYAERGLYVSFSEDKGRFYASMGNLGYNFSQLADRGVFEFIEVPSQTEEQIRGIPDDIYEALERLKPSRLVVDSFTWMAQSQGSGYAVRQLAQEGIKLLLTKGMNCTTMVIGERPMGESRLGPEEFIADGVIVLKHSIPRELEILKMRGTRIGRTSLLFTINKGFEAVTTTIDAPSKPGHWRPIVDSGDLLSTGSPDMDRMLGGGFPRGSYVVLEADPNVELKEVRLLTLGVGMNFASQGRGVFYLPPGGFRSREVAELMHRYLTRRDMVNVRVAGHVESGTARSKTITATEPQRAPAAEGSADGLDLLTSVPVELKAATHGQPVYTAYIYDILEAKYSEIPDIVFRRFGRDILRTSVSGDLTIALARSTTPEIDRIRSTVDWHFRLSKKNGAVMLWGVKPETPIYAMGSDVTLGYPVLTLKQFD